MRLYISMLAAVGLMGSACGKKEVKPEAAADATTAPEPKPETAKTEADAGAAPAADAAAAQADAAAPAADVQAAQADAAPAAPVDRSAGTVAAFAAFNEGKFEDAFANYTDDAVWYNVGSAEQAEVKGKATIVEAMKASPKLGEQKLTIGRVIEAGDFVAVEYVVTGKATAKAEDGTESTKDVGLVSALVLQFNAEGKVTTAWSFRDEVNMAQQMGAMPGLAEGFKAAVPAETAEMVKGEANPAIKDLYTTFFGKIVTPENIDAAVAEHVADDFKMFDSMSGATFDKAGVPAWAKGYTSMFGGMTVTVDNAILAGDYGVFVVTNKATYKGGIPGVEAKDQALTWKSLDIVKAKDGKFASFMTYYNTIEVFSALGLLGGAGEKPAEAAADAIGVASCDLYVKNVTACINALPEAARGPATEAMANAVKQWKELAGGGDEAKTALEAGCKTAYEESKKALATMCPDVKWE